MELRHVVITSVTRDDLPDGGAQQFVRCIEAIRALKRGLSVEVLTPDFRNKEGALEAIVAAGPDLFNHNLETVPRLYPSIRSGASYHHSLALLRRVKEQAPRIFSKSGLMLGLGEEQEEILRVMEDLRSAGVDFLTLGQYLQPSRAHVAVSRYLSPEEFSAYAEEAKSRGFLMVASSPLTRSSHHADQDYARLKVARSSFDRS